MMRTLFVTLYVMQNIFGDINLTFLMIVTLLLNKLTLETCGAVTQEVTFNLPEFVLNHYAVDLQIFK